MSKINMFALGGLGENGKNMYVIDVDSNYFILDAGIKYPTSEFYGVDEIIPDYRMLLEKQDKIKGIFMSHAHEDHIGALVHVLKDLNVPVYATNFTMEIIKDSLKDSKLDFEKLSLNTIDSNQTLNFGKTRVSFFRTTHSIPESIGIAIHTDQGVIVYTSEFTFNQSGDSQYQTDFKKISKLADEKILALLTESVGSDNATLSDNEVLSQKLNSILTNTDGRIIVSLFSSDLQKIQTIINIALTFKKKIAIIGRRSQRIVDIAIKEGYLVIPPESLVNLRYIDEKNKNNDKNIVALVTGNRHEPFYMLQRMCQKIDRLIHIESTDTVIIMTAPVPGTEKMAARTLDVLYRSDTNVERIDEKLLSNSHASQEEIKLMINLLKPKYIIPTIGEYRHQYQVKKIALAMGYRDDEVFLIDNGDEISFEKNKVEVSKKQYILDEILIDGTPIGNDDFVLRDRELLGQDGAILIVASVNPKTKKVIGEVQIVTRGFIYVKESADLIEEIKKKFHELSKKHLSMKYINWFEYKKDIRDGISKFLYNETKRRPITIPVIISVDYQ